MSAPTRECCGRKPLAAGRFLCGRHGHYSLRCVTCGVVTPWRDNMEDALENWNAYHALSREAEPVP